MALQVNNMLTFLGGRVTSMSASFGFNSSPSTLNISLVDDPNHPTDPTSFNEGSDIGDYVLLDLSTAISTAVFKFGGIITSINEPARDVTNTYFRNTGGGIYTISVSDPREIMKNIIVSLVPTSFQLTHNAKDVNGTPIDINDRFISIIQQFDNAEIMGRVNVFDDAFGFATTNLFLNLSEYNEVGIPARNIIRAIQGGTSSRAKGMAQITLEKKQFTVFKNNYTFDLSEIENRINGDTRIKGTFQTLSEVIEKFAELGAFDWYVETLDVGSPVNVKIKVIPRDKDSLDTGIDDYINNNTDITSTAGKGKELENGPSIIAIQSDFFEFLTKRDIEKFDESIDLTEEVAVLNNSSTLGGIRVLSPGQEGGNVVTFGSLSAGNNRFLHSPSRDEMRAALKNQEAWESYQFLISKSTNDASFIDTIIGNILSKILLSFSKGVRTQQRDGLSKTFSTNKGLTNSLIKPLVNHKWFGPNIETVTPKTITKYDYKDTPNGGNYNKKDIQEDISKEVENFVDIKAKIYNKIRSYAQRVYGKLYKYKKLVGNSQEISGAFTRGASNGGFNSDVDKFFEDDSGIIGKTTAYCLFIDVSSDLIRNGILDISGYDKSDIFFINDKSTIEISDITLGVKSIMAVRCNVLNGLLTLKAPIKIKAKDITVTLSQTVVDDFEKGSVDDNINVRNWLKNNFAATDMEDPVLTPDVVYLPSKSKYERWNIFFSTKRGEGKVEIREDTSLNPQAFNGLVFMNDFGKKLVENAGAKLHKKNSGTITLAGLPDKSLGDKIGEHANITAISFSVGVDGFTTTMQFNDVYRKKQAEQREKYVAIVKNTNAIKELHEKFNAFIIEQSKFNKQNDGKKI